jgi:hypothetical protein
MFVIELRQPTNTKTKKPLNYLTKTKQQSDEKNCTIIFVLLSL